MASPEYLRAWRSANPDRHKAHKRRARVLERKRHREKYLAWKAVEYALATGRLHRQPCETCGAPDVHAHHDDYERRLDVHWLCSGCHRRTHTRG